MSVGGHNFKHLALLVRYLLQGGRYITLVLVFRGSSIGIAAVPKMIPLRNFGIGWTIVLHWDVLVRRNGRSSYRRIIIMTTSIYLMRERSREILKMVIFIVLACMVEISTIV